MIVKYDIPLYKCENSFGDRLSEIMKKYDYEMVMGNFRNDFQFFYTKTKKHKYEVSWVENFGLTYGFCNLDKIEEGIFRRGELKPPHWYEIKEDLNTMILENFKILDTLKKYVGFKCINKGLIDISYSIGMNDIKESDKDFEIIKEWLEK